MDLYNLILNDPLYSTIAVLLALIVVFSVIKRYAKLIIFAVSIFVIYISYLIYQGNNIPETTEELKKQMKKDGEIMLNKAKKIITD